MTFVKEKIIDNDLEGLDPLILNAINSHDPVERRQDKQWVIDREAGITLIPATDWHFSRDRISRFLLVMQNLKIWLIHHGYPSSPVEWSLWEGAQKHEIEQVKLVIEESLYAYYNEDGRHKRPDLEFKISDPFHIETIEELVERFNTSVVLISSMSKLNSAVRGSTSKKRAFISDYISNMFTEEDRNKLSEHVINNGGKGLTNEAVKIIRKFLLEPFWKRLF
jgi:hypothetical protein